MYTYFIRAPARKAPQRFLYCCTAAGMVLDYKDSKDLGRLIDEQLAFCKDVVSKLYEKK